MALQSAMAIAAARSSGPPRRAMFVSLEGVELQPPERVANADHVVDDVVLHFRLVGEGMANAGPARVQSEDAAAPCLLHARGSHGNAWIDWGIALGFGRVAAMSGAVSSGPRSRAIPSETVGEGILPFLISNRDGEQSSSVARPFQRAQAA